MMIVFKVNDMMCGHCEKRIKDAFEKAGISAQVELESKTVKVDEKDEKAASELLDDLGFDAVPCR